MDVDESVEAKRVAQLHEIGDAIAKWRRKSQRVGQRLYGPLSMEELASAIGRSMSTVQRWERGVMEPKVSDLRRMDKVKPGLLELLFPRVARSN